MFKTSILQNTYGKLLLNAVNLPIEEENFCEKEWKNKMRCNIYYVRSCRFSQCLIKVVFPIFSIVCFSSLKESTCETGKNALYFTLKAFSVLKKIKFQIFRDSNFKTSTA